MGLGYLKGQNWADISREERFYCSHLYHSLLDENNKKTFLNLLKENNRPADNIPLSALESINTDDEWEAGFEVCFYRDMLLKYGISVKKNELEIAEKEKMIKRTFDLCLFSNTTIIIIEAKCLSDLDGKQYADFGLDRHFITAMYKYLTEKQNTKEFTVQSPKHIYTVFLASTKYYESASFKKSNGIGKKIVEHFNVNAASKFDKFISWKQAEMLPVQPIVPGIFKRANNT